MDYQNIEERVLLLKVSDEQEERRVTFWVDDGAAVIMERCDGEVTMAAFGSFAHVRRVRITADQVGAACVAIGGSAAAISEALVAYFSDEDVYLSDLQDALDRAGVGYSCGVWNGSEAAYRAATP